MLAFLVKNVFILLFKLKGWKVGEHSLNQVNKSVLIAAPHTSNWDFVFTIAAFTLLGTPIRFTIKKEWLRFPFKGMMEDLGAIGIDRQAKEDKVGGTAALMAEIVKNTDSIALVVTAEGSRSLRTSWKTGFYYIAKEANVPVLLGYMDYSTKTAGIGKVVYLTDNMKEDMRIIMDFYKGIAPKYPEMFSVDESYYSE